MALAWKAGWVHTLTSSNLVSSAKPIPALTRAGIIVSDSVGQPQPGLCAIFALIFAKAPPRTLIGGPPAEPPQCQTSSVTASERV